MAQTRPPEELYDLEKDPFELHNVAAGYQAVLKEMRAALEKWLSETDDRGRTPESEAMYDSDMAVYLSSQRDNRSGIIRRNIERMKHWKGNLVNRILVPAIISIMTGAAVIRPATAAESRKPKLLVILADDLGWGSVNCYGADPKRVKTPNIDRLARDGRRFTDANTTSSVCTPTRYSLLTGRYCWRTSLQHEVPGYTAPLHIEPDRLNLASMLKRHGYATAAVGKWHLGYGAGKADYTQPLRLGPLEIGFDYHFGVPSNHGDVTGVFVENHGVSGLRSTKREPKYGNSFSGRPYIGLDAPQRVDEAVMPTLTDKAVTWLEKQDAGKPFFLYFTPVAVHNPVTPSAKIRGTSTAGSFGDWIHELDVLVGRILDALDHKKFTDNTIIVFTSDNGGVYTPERDVPQTEAFNAGLKVNGRFRGGKHSVFEGGFRVPFLVRWPGKTPAGSVCSETISVADMLATVAAVVGEKLPPGPQAAQDSYSVLPALLDEKYTSPLRPDMIVHSADGNFAIRRGPWKYIEGKAHPAAKPGALKARAAEFRSQLYHLGEDPAEKRDVLDQNPGVAKRLRALLDKYRAQGHSR
jgi:arylsulfatase A-like enzyme